MEAVLAVAAPLFWGLAVFSILVFIHEGGHFLAARACGVRVTEFFLGLPCRWRLSRVSRRIGTRFGVTPLLLGGYAMISGMDPSDSVHAAAALALVHRKGQISVEDAARELGCSEEEALEAMVQLMDWGSVAGVYDASKGERPGGSLYPSAFAAMPRDRRGLTVYDGRAFDRAHATAQGEPWEPTMGDEEFLEAERSHTYLGKGFWKRAAMLVAGVAMNVLSGFLILVLIYSVVGIELTVNENRIGAVAEGSVAAEAGLEAGDIIESLGGTETPDWLAIVDAVDACAGAGPVDVVFERDGEQGSATVELGEGESLGISAPSSVIRLNPIDSVRVSAAYVGATLDSILQLLNPSQTMQVLDNSSSIVGISVMSAEMAAEGPAMLLSFAALISFSLGFMNLLPIPPLDGGKLLIEAIQAVSRRRVPLKVQTALSYIGVLLFCALFIYVLRADIIRLIL